MGADLLFVLRGLRRRPAFTITSVLTLALGLGLAAGIFSFADGYLFRPLPFPSPDQLYRVRDPHAKIALLAVDTIALRQSPVGDFGFVDWSTSDRLFGEMAIGDRRVEILPYDVSPNFGQTLGVPLLAGRWFDDADHHDVLPVPVVLSHRFWQREFGGDPRVLGQSYRVEGSRAVDVAVVGILSPRVTSFDPNNPPPDVIAPELPREIPPQRREMTLSSPIVRLPDGMSREQGEARVSAALQAVAPTADGRARQVQLRPLRDSQVAGGAPTARVLFAGAILILLLVTVNLVHLLLAQGVARAREVATRAALGASRWRVMRLFVIEGLVIGAAGIAGGLVLGLWMSRLIAARVPLYPTGGRNLAMMPILYDARVVVVVAVIGLIVAVASGLLPAWRAVRGPLHAAARTDASASASLPARLSRGVLASELAVATVLLLGAVFIGAGIWRYLNPPLGYRYDDRVRVEISPSGDGRFSVTPSEWTSMRAVIAATPGVRGVGVYQLGRGLPAEVRGEPLRDARVSPVPDGHLDAWQTLLAAGRWFTAEEYKTEAPVAIVDAAFARRVWSDSSDQGQVLPQFGQAVGQELRVESVTYRVVGVVEAQVRSLRTAPAGEAYIPRREPSQFSAFVAWAPGVTAADLEQRLTAALRSSMPAAVVRTEPVTRMWLFNRQTGEAEFQGPLMTAFAILTFVLAGVGIFGLVSYLVAQRTRELGIRIALGAGRADIWRSVIRDSVMPAIAGLVVGTAAAWALGRYVRATAFGWDAPGGLAVGIVSVAVLVIAVAAAIAPARRALRIDPVVVLRAE